MVPLISETRKLKALSLTNLKMTYLRAVKTLVKSIDAFKDYFISKLGYIYFSATKPA